MTMEITTHGHFQESMTLSLIPEDEENINDTWNDTWNDSNMLQKSFWINRNGSKGVFRLTCFREFTISHELLWEFLFNISESLDRHNQGHTRIFTWNFSYQLIVKATCRVVKVLHQCNGLRRNNSFVTWSIFYHIP